MNMKKLIYFVIALMFLAVVPEITFAQSNDPFEQETLKATGNTVKREKKINRKKSVENEEAPKGETTKPTKEKETPKPVKANEMTISNPCDDWLDFEFVSLVGSRGSQTVKLTAKITNHDSNKKMYVGGRFISYDSEGNEHNTSSYTSYNMITDVPVKITLDVSGKINPAKTTVMPVISFNIDDCRIEMRNVPINWK